MVGIALLFLIWGGYYTYQSSKDKKNGTEYVTKPVERGSLIVSIMGDGQVLASNQVDLKPKVSGEIVTILVNNNQAVAKNEVIARLDARDAYKAVRDAEINLESAKLSLEKLLQPADDFSLLQAENTATKARNDWEKLKFEQKTELQKANEAKEKAEDNIKKAYEDGFNTISDAFLDLPDLINGLDGILFDEDINSNQENLSAYGDMVKKYDNKVLRYADDAKKSFEKARKKYDRNFENYKSVSRYSHAETVENLINETYQTTKDMAEAIKSMNNLIDFVVDIKTENNLKGIFPVTQGHKNSLNSFTNTTNSHLLSLLSIQRIIEDNKEAKLNAERDLEEMERNHPLDLAAAGRTAMEKMEAMEKLKEDSDPLDIKAQELTVKQRRNALRDARERLADYYIRAPFDGIVTQIEVEDGSSVSASTAIGKLITEQMLAEILLNEVDVAKVQTRQKATLTFDAIEDLSITGAVTEIESLGTVSQGVVTYKIKIAFDTQDTRIKPGMTVAVTIITDAKTDVLLVPSLAVKSRNGRGSYVKILEGKIPRRQPVELGASNDVLIEILEGVEEGDEVVTQSIELNNNTNNQNSGFRIPGMRGMGGGRRR